jgi:Peptidase M15
MATKSIRTRRRSERTAAAVVGLALLAASGGAAAANEPCAAAATARAPRFALKFGDEVSPLPLVATSVMPGAQLELEAVLTEKPARFEATADAGGIETLREDRWRWQAPGEPGMHGIAVHDAVSDTTACLRVFVLRPYAGEETLDGYRIGAYPPGAAPPGLIRVDADIVDVPVSPHFRVRPFLAKQEGGFPKYLALRTRLLLALEAIASALREKGRDQLTVMSGYRTPYYNAEIGNETSKSRHLLGDAADVYVDQDGDGRMDDLDGDGSVTEADARLLFVWIEEMSAQPWFKPFVGGLAVYPANPHHGPFVHVDVRGQSVRW